MCVGARKELCEPKTKISLRFGYSEINWQKQ